MHFTDSWAEVLGLADPTAFSSLIDLADYIEDGVPLAALDRLSETVAPGDRQFKYRLVTRASYGRRKATQKLSIEEGTKVMRLARVWSIALDVWGSAEEACAFLFRQHGMLRDRKPVDVIIQSEFGAESVIEILGRLKYGTSA